jgi:hypothetical protein
MIEYASTHLYFVWSLWNLMCFGAGEKHYIMILMSRWKLPFQMLILIFYGDQHVAYINPILCQISIASFEPTQSTNTVTTLSTPSKFEVGVFVLG